MTATASAGSRSPALASLSVAHSVKATRALERASFGRFPTHLGEHLTMQPMRVAFSSEVRA